MTTATETESRVLPAGTYWVGDPCYAFNDHALWGDLLDSAWIDGGRIIPQIMDAKVEKDGEVFIFVASGTAHGDGCFPDNAGHEYGVDAGMIGVVPAREGEEVPRGLREVTFDKPFTVGYDDGDIEIGHLTIETDPKSYCEGCSAQIDGGEDYCYACEPEEEEEDWS